MNQHEVFALQQRRLEAARAEEHAAATELLREYAQRFQDAGIAPFTLRAKPERGPFSVRTTITGWYLKSDRSIGMDTEGRFYALRAPSDLLTRLRGAELEPLDAVLEVGRGGPDGSVIGLRDLLEMRLADPIPPKDQR